MKNPADFKESYEAFFGEVSDEIADFQGGKYRTTLEDLDERWRNIRLGEQRRRFLDLVAFVRLLRDIYGHPFIKEIAEYASEIGLTVRELDLSIVDSAENLALTMLEDMWYKWWMEWLGSFGVEKRLARPGYISYGIADGFRFLTVIEGKKGFDVELMEWPRILEGITRLNTLSQWKD